MKRKLMALLLVMAMLCSLAACGGSTPQAGGESAPAAPAAPDTPQQDNAGSEEIVEIHMANWRVEEIEAFEAINAEFMKEYPNIRPVYDAIKATEYDSKIAMDFTSGTCADIVYVRPFDRGYDLYKAGYLEPLTLETVPNLANVAALQTDVYAEAGTGVIYAAPATYINYGFMYNKTLFDQLQLEEPETWEEFFAVCDAIKAAGITPLAFGIKDTWILSACVSDSIFGSFVGGEAGRQKLLAGEMTPTSPEMVAHLEMINRFKDYMPANYEGVSYTDNVQMFAMEQAAIYPGGSFDVGYIRSQDLAFELDVFAPPVVNAGDTRWSSMNGGMGLGLNASSEHKEEALIYINWLLSEKAQIMLGNAAPGLFPCANVDAAQLTDPVIGEMVAFGGDAGELYTISWCMKFNGGTPTATALADENISLMLQGQLTPQDVAKIIEDGVATWYAPWQK